MIKTRQFYDTCSLLLKAGNLFDEPKDFIISSITLQELENIKISTNKDDNVKFSARQLLHDLDEHFGQYLIINYQNTYAQNITQRDFELTNDTKILSCYLECVRLFPEEKIVFITNDLALKSIARVFTSNIQSLEEDKPDDYTGYKEITMSDDCMGDFYTNPSENEWNLQIGEYILVKNTEGEIVDRLCWNGEYYRHLDYKSFNSRWFGEVKPIKGDAYQ
jgi:predicted ribonuclease YlaK